MTLNNPDRFERMVNNCYFNDRSDAADAIKLLRQEHRWMIKMIQTMKVQPWERRAILDKLTQRAK